MNGTRSKQGLDGVLLVDKEVGPTSHDVVGLARRRLSTRKIGHAGTLDPMASGVLVLLVGEGTKLGPYLTAHWKRYRARVAFGLATDTLDREGTPMVRTEPPAWLREELAALESGREAPRINAALADERARRGQIPPAYSAIKVDGQRSYARARAGEAVELAERSVDVREIEALDTTAGGQQDLPFLDVELYVSKGYYVRSFARDLGAHLGVPSHLSALRRTASGPFTLERSVVLEQASASALLSIEDAASEALPCGRLTDQGTRIARRGQPLRYEDFLELPPVGEASAWLDPAGKLVAIGSRGENEFSILRGFSEG